MGGCSYLYGAPAMMVVPLFVISIINTFVAGPPLETLVFDAQNDVALSYMQSKVQNNNVTISLSPRNAMSHYFVFTCYVPKKWELDGVVKRPPLSATVRAWSGDDASAARVLGAAAHAGAAEPSQHEYGVQLLQPLEGFEHYEIVLNAGTPVTPASAYPRMEFRLTYVPPKFTHTQIGVRSFFVLVTIALLVAFCCAGSHVDGLGDPLSGWIGLIVLLLLGVNDPLYAVRIWKLGSESLEQLSTVVQIVFSAALFLFWLVMADGMHRASAKTFVGFYLPKIALVLAYTASACALFLVHGRLPDRLEISNLATTDSATSALVGVLIGCLTLMCAWLVLLVGRLTYRLGWKQVEYMYTEREKSFLGMTLVFISLWVCGLAYRAVHGQRGSWLMLQLPFLALCNSYVMLLVNAFWPGNESSIAQSIAASGGGDDGGADERGGDSSGKDRQGLLSPGGEYDDDDDDE